MLTDNLRVLVYKKIIILITFIFLITVALKFFYNNLLSYVLRTSVNKIHKVSSCHNTPT